MSTKQDSGATDGSAPPEPMAGRAGADSSAGPAAPVNGADATDHPTDRPTEHDDGETTEFTGSVDDVGVAPVEDDGEIAEAEAGAVGDVAPDQGDEPPDNEDDDDDEDFPVEVEDDATESSAEAAIADLMGKLAVMDEKRQQLEREKKEFHDRLLRSTADLENFRRRSRKEVEDARIDSRSKVLKEMLPVIDNLERAVEHAQTSGETDGAATQILEGVQLVLRSFSQALERFDVKLVEAAGQPFDPNFHEAIAQAPATVEAPAGTIATVMQQGYTIGSRLLRPSLVVVAAGPTPAPPAEEDDAGEPEGTDGPDSPDSGSDGESPRHDAEPEQAAVDPAAEDGKES